MRVISYGGGVQSTSLVVLAALHDEAFERAMGGPVDAALFANVGDDSEDPRTLAYVRDIIQPWAGERGLLVEELRRTKRDGSVETLRGRITNPEHRVITIPAFGENGIIGVPRHCTNDFKVVPISRWIRAHRTDRHELASIAIGISTDEIERAHVKTQPAGEKRIYPLLDLRMDRSRCAAVIKGAGLPIPSKSACYFCPFHRPQIWRELRRDRPRLFASAAELEATINERRAGMGQKLIYLTRFAKPLPDAVAEAQDTLFGGIEEGGCDDGYCWT